MTKPRMHRILKVIFTLFMLSSAFGELTYHDTVVHSMQVIEMPIYLLPLLGSLKILGVAALWFSPYPWLQEWAYAGFIFDFVGAIYAFLAVGELVTPDIIMAPVALLLVVLTYVTGKAEAVRLSVA